MCGFWGNSFEMTKQIANMFMNMSLPQLNQMKTKKTLLSVEGNSSN